MDNLTGSYSTTAIMVDANISNSVFNIENCTALAGHYAISIASDSNNTINIKHSNLTGWAAIQVWGNNNSVYCSYSILTGISKYLDSSFGTLVFEGNNEGYKAENCYI